MAHRIQISAELIPEPKEGGYTAYCPEFDVASQGDDPDDAIKNLKEALFGYIKTIGIREAFKSYRHPIREIIELHIA